MRRLDIGFAADLFSGGWGRCSLDLLLFGHFSLAAELSRTSRNISTIISHTRTYTSAFSFISPQCIYYCIHRPCCSAAMALNWDKLDKLRSDFANKPKFALVEAKRQLKKKPNDPYLQVASLT